MGLTLLRQLAKLQEKFLVTMVNRGKKYWDGESVKIVKSNENILHCKADRRSDKFTDIVSAHLISHGLPLTHVIDFSCFKT